MTARRWLAAVWIVLVATAAIGHVADRPWLTVGAWFAALMMVAGSGSTINAQRDERLELPRLYRGIAAIAFVIPLGAALLTWVPHHSEWSTVLSVYFVVVAWLAYRALVARGPRPARVALAVSLLAWTPFMVLACMGCRCGHYVAPPIHWTETVSWLALLATQLCSGLTVAASLVSFARVTDEVPEARLQGPWRITPASAAR